jgi:hypothetical protein
MSAIDYPRGHVRGQAEQPLSLLGREPQTGHLPELGQDTMDELIACRRVPSPFGN